MASVTVRLSETYDLSTKRDSVGIIGIHTPSSTLINAMYPGLMQNFRKISIDTCEVVLACASQLPADPLQISTEAGKIAPQDMFNPLLYRAVSNDSFGTIRNRMITIGQAGTTFPSTSIDGNNTLFTQNATQAERTYYAMLAMSGWKKAMPQQGIRMSGLYPIVYEVVNTFGGVAKYSETVGEQNVKSYNWSDEGLNVENQVSTGNLGPSSGMVVARNPRAPATMRGASKRMPALPIHNDVGDTGIDIPVTYVGMILTPPAKLNITYFRLRVSWLVTFHDVIPIQEYSGYTQYSGLGGIVYGSDYVFQSKDADSKQNMVDGFDTDITQVM